MRAVLLAFVAFITLSNVAYVHAEERPFDVPKEKWVSISPTVGIAILHVETVTIYDPDTSTSRQESLGEATGVLMAKVEGKWVKIRFEAGPLRIVPAR